jgi:hypothetical protein
MLAKKLLKSWTITYSLFLSTGSIGAGRHAMLLRPLGGEFNQQSTDWQSNSLSTKIRLNFYKRTVLNHSQIAKAKKFLP